MNIRLAFSIIFALLSGAIAVCAVVAFHSEKEIGKPLGSMLLKLIPPIIGNALIIIASSKPLATVGCYMYYIGIDFSVFGLLRYVLAYGKLEWRSSGLRILVLSLFGLDILQLLANIAFGHAFSIEAIELYGSVYYRMIPYLPQNLHRALVYAVLAASVVILFLKMIHSSRIHARRYGVLLTSLLVVIVWCSFYVISRTPLDRSMIGYAVFGLLAFYFSLYYKPVRLLNRIMVDMSAELPDALFFFDDAGACIWANNKGQQLAGVSAGHFQGVEEKLKPFFESGGEGDSWTSTLELDEGGNRKYYALEKRTIRDGKGRIDGSFLNIRDDTQAQLNLQQETYRARHDELTGLYNRPYLYQCISRMLTEAEPGAAYNVVFINVSNFKLINDIFGHSFGDKVLIRIARLLCKHVPEGGVYGRLAGDTFGVFLPVGAMRIDQVERTVSSFAVSTGVTDYHVLIHLGVYRVVDPVLEVSVMFDRARIAASNVRNDYHTHIAFYDDAMRSRMLWEQEISIRAAGRPGGPADRAVPAAAGGHAGKGRGRGGAGSLEPSGSRVHVAGVVHSHL